MPILPQEIIKTIRPFAQVFSERVWDWVQVMVAGAILAPGKRTVTAVLRVMGLKDEKQYQNYHRVLNRAKWSGLQVSRILLGMLVQVLKRWNGAGDPRSRKRGSFAMQCGRAKSTRCTVRVCVG